MDMEVDLVLGGPGAGLSDPVRMDPMKMGFRAVANGQRTLAAGFTTVRNLGLFIKTGGYLVDVALADAIDAGWVQGPRVIPAGHAICPTGGHLDPSAQSGVAPDIMPMTIEEGIADGIDEVRKAVRYQIKHGAQLIKCCASGGVMTPTGPPGAQQYSTEELAAIADEAHRRGLRVATHCHGDTAVNAASAACCTTARISGESRTTKRQCWALAPLGPQVAASRQRPSVSSSTGPSVKRRIARAVDSTSHTSSLPRACCVIARRCGA
jgi:imidazolonepropionase-like amidohydrolase